MAMIYEPRGKAREYSPLALNLYMGCTHKCKYCYAPHCIQKTAEAYYATPEPRKNVVESLEKELQREVPKEQVLLTSLPQRIRTAPQQAARQLQTARAKK